MDRIIKSPQSLRVDKKHIPTVKKACADSGFWNQTALAEAAGCVQSTIGRFLSGKPIKQNRFIRICDRLGLNWEDIMHRQDDMPKTSPETSLESNQTVHKPQLNWHQICHGVHKKQRRRQLFSCQVIERNLGNKCSGVYVPLGVVKPKLASDPEKHFSRDDFLKRIVKQRTNLAIVGNFGTGKSTWLEQIALHVAEEKIGFPICIPASALRGKTLKDYLLTDWLEEALPFLNPEANQVSDIEKTKLRKLFRTRKVWLLVDAIDEMSVPPESDSPVKAIAKQLIGWLSEARIVLTCQPNIWQRGNFALPNFETYHTVDFDDRQINQFMSLWFEKSGNKWLGEWLLYKLSESKIKPMQDLGKNPFFLSIICGIWLLSPEDFPKSKAELYGKFIEYFYKWQEYKLQIDWSQQQELNASLAELALIAFEDSSALKETRILKILGKTLFKKACTVGWLVQVAKDSQTNEPVYAFLHFSFQELFAAKAIAKNYDWHFFLHHVPGNPSEGSYRIFDPKWWNIYVFWMGEPSVTSASKSALLGALVAFEDKSGFSFYRWRAYCIAAEGLPEFKDCPPFLADEIVGTIVKLSIGVIEAEQPLTRLHPSIVASAQTALFGTDAKRAVDFLVSNLSLFVEDEHLQKDIAEILGEIGICHPKAIQALSQLLLRNPDKKTNMIWVNCLAKIGIGDSNAIYTLTELFHQSSDEPTRLEIAKKLIKIDPYSECAIAFLLDQNLSKSYLLSILNGFNNQVVTNILIQRLDDATDDSIRLKFAKLLSLINPEEALSYIQELLDKPEEEIRLEAACTLQEISPNHPQVIPTLDNLLTTCQNNLLVYRAAMRLESIKPGSRNVQKAINKLLNSKDTSIVLKTAKRWFEIKANPYPIVDILLKIVGGSENRADREEAARILLKMSAKDQTVTKSIIELFYKQPDEETHRVVAWYLGEIIPASSETLRVLIECLSSPIAESVQRQAIVSLGQVGENNWDAVNALIGFLQSPVDEELRREALQSLGKIGFNNLNAIEAFKNLLDKTKDEEKFFLAAYTLSQTSTSTDKLKAIQALKELIYSSRYLTIKFQAAIALWQQFPGNINILKILILLLLDDQGDPNSFRIHKSTKYGSLQETIAKCLKTWVLTEQLPIIINTIQRYKSTQNVGSLALYNLYGYSIIWYYAQNLPYDKFYQACRGE
jgi:HEAT repeat protein/DNA-binding Xre family transcriptional regulator